MEGVSTVSQYALRREDFANSRYVFPGKVTSCIFCIIDFDCFTADVIHATRLKNKLPNQIHRHQHLSVVFNVNGLWTWLDKTTSTSPYANLCLTRSMSVMETLRHPDFPAKSLDFTPTGNLCNYLENCTPCQADKMAVRRRNQLLRKRITHSSLGRLVQLLISYEDCEDSDFPTLLLENIVQWTAENVSWTIFSYTCLLRHSWRQSSLLSEVLFASELKPASTSLTCLNER